jgi:hypothetical protein
MMVTEMPKRKAQYIWLIGLILCVSMTPGCSGQQTKQSAPPIDVETTIEETDDTVKGLSQNHPKTVPHSNGKRSFLPKLKPNIKRGNNRQPSSNQALSAIGTKSARTPSPSPKLRPAAKRDPIKSKVTKTKASSGSTPELRSSSSQSTRDLTGEASQEAPDLLAKAHRLRVQKKPGK